MVDVVSWVVWLVSSVVELVETPLHLGPLHPLEQTLVFVLAFGPFVLLALTIWRSRRRNPRDPDRPAT